jgi:non-ribosomal peptide synthetase component F
MTSKVQAPHHSISSSADFFVRCGAWIQTKYSQHIAIISSSGELTYAELAEAVESRATIFQQENLTRQIVALQRTKSYSYVIDLLALLSVGAITMPIDPSLPPACREEMVKLAQPVALVTEDGSITVDGTASELNLSEVQRSEAAYVFFTSGSTGRPKAILGARKALRHFIEWQGQEFEIGLEDRIPFLTHIGFDVSLRDVLLPLCHGAKLLIPDEAVTEKPQLTLNWLRQNGVTRLHTVPSVVRIWAQCATGLIPSLRTVFSAGEKLTPGTLTAIRSVANPNVEVVNLYGPTETTLAKFFYRLDPDETVKGSSAPVGQPLPKTSYSLGTEGEIIITTPDASLGYLGASSDENRRFHIANELTVMVK